MWLSLLVCQFGLVLFSEAQNPCFSHTTFREPANSDISVICGTRTMELTILLCPIYYGGYNESLMSLNAQYYRPECYGIPDWSADPPVLKFNFSITEEAISTCSNKLKISQEVGSGLFSDYSSVQFVNVSGIINSLDPSAGTITYRQEMMYIFSCRYPLQYLINNTEITVSGVSLAVRDNNGSFISTLSMQLYEDSSYTTHLKIPESGLKLKKRIFVEVKATNLTERFNVLLDRCYATTSPFPINSSYYDLFVGCNRDGQTVITSNGQTQTARFSFEAFRFVEHKNMTVSIFYLHCATRLCETSVCSSVLPNCSANARAKRDLQSQAQSTTVSEVATVTSGPIITRVDSGGPPGQDTQVAEESYRDSPVFRAAVAAGVVGVLCIAMVAFTVLRIHSSKRQSKKKALWEGAKGSE
ncbi:zona pellucida-like domain-containing protein 1 [Brienomyrus brachyistius]|uniref:zona pellucida-like domain-containing protein 1 n=1 Tax=Brienomyrus brachyistius TaxID=42636 RepID=UPI0020B183BF|nr:zona pellucida-like domain-containing protein 1 [Brienomyrus brachyistius]